MKAILISLAGLMLTGAGITEARIALPPELAQAERIELRGMGGGSRGKFRLGETQGRFTRTADRLGIFDPLVVRRSGGGRFATADGLEGRCAWREGDLNAGPISIRDQRLAYRCQFRRDGRPLAAELVLDDPQGAFGTLHGRAQRRGVLWYDGREIEIRSIHRDARGGLPTPTPLGYGFSLAGRPVGAIDVNGPNKTLVLPAEAELRDAVTAASLALAIFRDPADLEE